MEICRYWGVRRAGRYFDLGRGGAAECAAVWYFAGAVLLPHLRNGAERGQ